MKNQFKQAEPRKKKDRTQKSSKVVVNKKPIGERTKRLHESREDRAIRIECMLPEVDKSAVKKVKSAPKGHKPKVIYKPEEIKAIVTAGLRRAEERKLEYAIMREESFKRRTENKAKKLTKKAA